MEVGCDSRFRLIRTGRDGLDGYADCYSRQPQVVLDALNWSDVGHYTNRFSAASQIHVATAKNCFGKIYGSSHGLETLLRTRRFQCSLILVSGVYPNGDLFYACHPLRQKAANILEKGWFRKAWRAGSKLFLRMPPCDNRCHLLCYVNNRNGWSTRSKWYASTCASLHRHSQGSNFFRMLGMRKISEHRDR